MKKFTAVFLICAVIVSLTACEADTSAQYTTTSSSETTVPAEVTTEHEERADAKDSLPDNLDFDGKVIRIAYNGGFRNDGMFDEMQATEQVGDLVNDAIYARNMKVAERLNVEFEYDICSGGTNGVANVMRTTISAGEDAWDIISNGQWGTMPLMADGLFYDLSDAPYLDYAQPWWFDDYMNTISINESTRHVLRGELSLQTLYYLSASFVNKRLYEDNFSSIDDFYQLVLEGKWTLDKMREYSQQIYHDVNGNGVVDEGDTVGYGTCPGGIVDHIAYPAGFKFTERGEDGYPRLLTDQSRNIKAAEALYKLFYETEGAFVVQSNESDRVTPMFFANGNALFHFGLLGSAEELRDMKDDFGIIPAPKLDEEQQNYLSLVHDSASVCAIPITLPDIDASCAVLEALCAETYRSVTTNYYEVALKIKYTRDNVSAQLIDIIHDNATTDFIYANNYVLGSGGSLGTLPRTLMEQKTSNYMSAYASQQASAEAAIAKLIKEFQ